LAGTAQAPSSIKSQGVQPLLVEPGTVTRSLWLLRRAFIAAYEDNCLSIAKGAAYSFLLSLFPVLTALASVLMQVKAQAVVHVIATFMAQVVPPGTEDLVLSRLPYRSVRPISLPLAALALSLWAGSGAMMSLMEGFQAAYRIPSGRPFLKQRAMAVFLVITAALPSVLASSLIIFGDRSERAFLHWVGNSHDGSELSAPLELLWRFARYALAFCTTTFVMGLLYYFGPNHRPQVQCARGSSSRFMRVWPGAFLATVLWLIATAGFAWYVGHRISSYNVFYGSVGAVIVLLIWLYLLACIALIGCEFNAERERIELLPTVTTC
jgi:membrane protein